MFISYSKYSKFTNERKNNIKNNLILSIFDIKCIITICRL